MEQLLSRLSSFDPAVRGEALHTLAATIERGGVKSMEPRKSWLNLHFHTFHSFNYNNWSPARVVFEAWRTGLRYAGTVDFDTLAALEETLTAGRLLGIKVCGGFESRVYLKEYGDKVLNSPKEPGIYYLCGKGFRREPDPASEEGRFFARMKEIAQERNRVIIERLNAFLKDVSLDERRDVLPLTPSGNPTERHMVAAYRKVSEERLGTKVDSFWAAVLGIPEEIVKEQRTVKPEDFEEVLRTKLIKYGGPGYIAPEPSRFPKLEEVAAMTKKAGGIPVGTWLDGTSNGESDPSALVACLERNGIEAMAVIPERNWHIKDPAEKEIKVANFDRFMAVCRERKMPVVCGTEMNKFGQPFTDDFTRPELAKYLSFFLESARMLVER